MEEIDLKDLLLIIRKRWWIALITTISAVALSVFLSFFVLKPVYQSDTSLYIGKKVDAQGAIAYNDILLGTQLVNDYRELVKSRLISEMVINELGLKNITPDQLAAKLSVNSKKDTRLIVISTQDADPEMARDITNKVAEVFKEKVVQIMQVENVQIIDKAEKPVSPVKPNKKLNIAIAFMLGLMIGFGVIFLVEYLDDTIKTPEDVQKHLNLPVIGTIPVFPE